MPLQNATSENISAGGDEEVYYVSAVQFLISSIPLKLHDSLEIDAQEEDDEEEFESYYAQKKSDINEWYFYFSRSLDS